MDACKEAGICIESPVGHKRFTFNIAGRIALPLKVFFNSVFPLYFSICQNSNQFFIGKKPGSSISSQFIGVGDYCLSCTQIVIKKLHWTSGTELYTGPLQSFVRHAVGFKLLQYLLHRKESGLKPRSCSPPPTFQQQARHLPAELPRK